MCELTPKTGKRTTRRSNGRGTRRKKENKKEEAAGFGRWVPRSRITGGTGRAAHVAAYRADCQGSI